MPRDQVIYKIVGWSEKCENDRSRTRDKLSWYAFPNQFDPIVDVQLRRTVNGLAAVGLLHRMLALVSMQPRPRTGLLTSTGGVDGEALTVADLSAITGQDEQVVAELLDLLSCPKVGLIEVVTPEGVDGESTVSDPPSDHARLTLEGIEGIEGRKRDPRAQARESAPAEEPEPTKRRSRRSRFDPVSDASMPDVLNNQEFLKAWAKWITHRRETGKPLKQTTTTEQLEKLEERALAHGVAAAVEVLDYSLTGGYQGLFFDRPVNGSKKNEPGEGAAGGDGAMVVQNNDGWDLASVCRRAGVPLAGDTDKGSKLWGEVLEALRTAMDTDRFDAYFRPLRCRGLNTTVVWLEGESSHQAKTIMNDFLEPVGDAVRKIWPAWGGKVVVGVREDEDDEDETAERGVAADQSRKLNGATAAC